MNFHRIRKMLKIRETRTISKHPVIHTLYDSPITVDQLCQLWHKWKWPRWLSKKNDTFPVNTIHTRCIYSVRFLKSSRSCEIRRSSIDTIRSFRSNHLDFGKFPIKNAFKIKVGYFLSHPLVFHSGKSRIRSLIKVGNFSESKFQSLDRSNSNNFLSQIANLITSPVFKLLFLC